MALQSPAPSAERPRWSSPGQSLDPEDEAFSTHVDDDRVRVTSQRSQNGHFRPLIVEVGAATSSSIINSPALKTTFCIYLTALAALPPTSAAVVYISTSPLKLSASRLNAQMISILSAQTGDDQSSEDQPLRSIAHDALSHVHIFNPSSTAQYSATIRGMSRYLSDFSKHKSANRKLRLIVLDSVDSFYWHDRMESELARLDPLESEETTTANVTVEVAAQQGEHRPPRERNLKSTFSSGNTNIRQALLDLASTYSSSLIYTSTSHSTHHLFSFPSSNQTHLHLQLSSLAASIPQFPAHLSAPEALRDRSKRRDVVRRGECVAVVVAGNEEQWQSDTQEKFRWRFTIQNGVIHEIPGNNGDL